MIEKSLSGATFSAPRRSEKPRNTGLTAIIDFGPDTFGWTGPRGVADFLDCAAAYVDFAKIYAMNALLLPKPVVIKIVSLYRDAGVIPYSGGILFEYAHERGEIDEFIAHLKSIGIPTLEISENYITISDEVRSRYIDRFQLAGLSVIYEFGRKNPLAPLDLDELGRLVAANRAQGIEHVILEQSELDLVRKEAPGKLEELRRARWFSDLLIEADPYAFPSQHAQLIRQFGADVNLANVAVAQAFRLEGLRRGVGRAVDYAMFRREGGTA
ncbi:MAG: phosphosulfolactate synthase [Rhodomicrobiaceae bacterium]